MAWPGTLYTRGIYPTGIETTSSGTVNQIQRGYEKVRKQGYYETIMKEMANLENKEAKEIIDSHVTETC